MWDKGLFYKSGFMLRSLPDGTHVTSIHAVSRQSTCCDTDNEGLLTEVRGSPLGPYQLVTLKLHEHGLGNARGTDEFTSVHPDRATGPDNSLTCRLRLRIRSPLVLSGQRRCLGNRGLLASVHHFQVVPDDPQWLEVVTLAGQDIPQSLDVRIGVLAVSRWCPLRGQQALGL